MGFARLFRADGRLAMAVSPSLVARFCFWAGAFARAQRNWPAVNDALKKS